MPMRLLLWNRRISQQETVYERRQQLSKCFSPSDQKTCERSLEEWIFPSAGTYCQQKNITNQECSL